MAKTYNEKLRHSGDLPKVAQIEGKKALRYHADTMLIAPPMAYDAQMKRVPEGRVTTIDRIMSHLAEQHGAGCTCPMTAGMFVNIAAHASVERAGIDETPYWRTLKKQGELSEKYPGGVAGQRALLEAEGHTIRQKGAKTFVAEYEARLFPLAEPETSDAKDQTHG